MTQPPRSRTTAKSLQATSEKSEGSFSMSDRLEQIIDQANVLVLATDMEGRVTVWNRAMARLTGFPREMAVGRDLHAWLSERGAPELAQRMRQVATGQDQPNCEARLPSVTAASKSGLDPSYRCRP